MQRDDLSDKLVHLTRGESDAAAAAVFLKVAQERRLLGGTGCIKGGYACVCFSESPLSKLAVVLSNPMAHDMRYSPFGVMVDKKWLHERGGRPVIYQPDSEYEALPAALRYRHVRYEPEEVDFTWEREWRFLGDELVLDPDACSLVVPNRAWERWFIEKYMAALGAKSRAFQGWVSHDPQPWHFVVLEDLGVELPEIGPPEA